MRSVKGHRRLYILNSIELSEQVHFGMFFFVLWIFIICSRVLKYANEKRKNTCFFRLHSQSMIIRPLISMHIYDKKKIDMLNDLNEIIDMKS